MKALVALSAFLAGAALAQGITPPKPGVRNPYLRPAEPAPVVPAQAGGAVSPIAPPAPRPSADLARQLVLVGVRGNAAMVREGADGKGVVHVLRHGQPWHFGGFELGVVVINDALPAVHLTADGALVAVINTRAAPVPAAEAGGEK